MQYSEAKKAKDAVESRTALEILVDLFNTKVLRRFKMKKLEPYTYLFVRQDLSIAQQFVQSNHAGIKAGEEFGNGISKSNMVLIGVPNKKSLYEAMDIMGRNDIPFIEFYEPDYEEGLTAICTNMLFDRKQRAVFKSYDLWQISNTKCY